MTAGLKYTLLAVVFLLGYTSMSFELLVLRQLINFVGSNTLITSVVITFILLFCLWAITSALSCDSPAPLTGAAAVCGTFPSAALWKVWP